MVLSRWAKGAAAASSLPAAALALPAALALLGGVTPAPVQAAASGPDLRILSPRKGEMLGSNSFDIDVSYRSRSGADVVAAEVWVDGVRWTRRALARVQARGVLSFAVDGSTLPEGTHRVEVRIFDARGQWSSAAVNIVAGTNTGTASGDFGGPELTFRGLTNGKRVSGVLELSVDATDRSGANPYVTFFIDKEFKTLKNYAPYNYTWDTTTATDGWHTVEVMAYVDATNATTTRRMRVYVDNASGNTQRMKDIPDLNDARVAPVTRPSKVAPVTIPVPRKPRTPAKQRRPKAPVLVDKNRKRGPVMVAKATFRGPSSVPSTPAGPPPRGQRLAVPGDGTPSWNSNAPASLSTPPELQLKVVPSIVSGVVGLRMAVPDNLGPASSSAPARIASRVRSGGPEPPAAVAPSLPSPAVRTPALPVAGSPAVRVAAAPKPARPAGTAAVRRSGDPTKTASVKRSGEPAKTATPTGIKPLARVTARKTVAARPAASPVATPRAEVKKAARATAKPLSRTTPRAVAAIATSALRDGAIQVAFNGERLAFDVQPRVDKGMPVAPFRQIFEHTGGVLNWAPDTKVMRAVNADREVVVAIGKSTARVNDRTFSLDRPAFLESGRTVVPLSFVGKALDVEVQFDARTGRLQISSK